MDNKLAFVNLSGKNKNDKFDLIGVRFGEKSFLFWKRKDSSPIRRVNVIFDKKYEEMPVQDGIIVLSLKGLNSYDDIRKAIFIFINNVGINKNNITFEFVIENENQRQLADTLGKEFDLSYVVNNINQNQNQNQSLKGIEERLNNKNSNISANGNEMIEKYDNGQLNKITVHNGIAYENNGILDSEEEKASLLKSWMQDPIKVREISSMSEEQLNDLLSREVLSNRKQYRLEDADEQLANDRAGKVALNIADQNGSLVNTELNIVQHIDFMDDNKYSAVEKDGDNVQIVEPNVTQTQISKSGLTNNIVSRDMENDFQVGELQQREISNQVFYIDVDSNIINDNYEIVGKIGVDGYQINYEDNSLVRYGQMVGYIGDYKDIGKSNSREKTNVRKKVLEKNTDEEKSGGFVSLAVIMFILSALLLMGSVVLLFVLD